MSGEICTDDRFEIIAAYKKKLIECTNIETRPEEMVVIDDILFRFWQMGWLPPIPHGRLIDADALEYEEAYLNGHYELGDVEIVTRKDIESAPTVIPATNKGLVNE